LEASKLRINMPCEAHQRTANQYSPENAEEGRDWVKCGELPKTMPRCQRRAVITGWKNPDSPGACQQTSRSPATEASSVSAARR
jgi:hypothetical protein